MMRCISCVVLVLASLIVVPAASADPITFSDTFDPANVFFVSSGSACTGTNGVTDSTSASTCRTLSWTHLLPGFNALTDTLTSATLSLWFYDDGDDAAEKVDLTLEENVFYNNQTVETETTLAAPFTIGFNVLNLVDDGELSALLSRQNGDFWFDRAVLTAAGDRREAELAPVPEPATLLLVGGGLAGLVARRRRKAKA